MFDDGLEGCYVVRRGSGAEMCGGRKQWYHLGNFKAKGSGWWRLTVRHAVSYGTFLTASKQSRSLCVFGGGRYWVRADETGSLG